MSAGNTWGRQLGDLAAYLLLPVLCLLLPTSWGTSLIRFCAARGWVLRARSQQACEAARRWSGPIADAAAWRRRWRLTELSDARDCWYYVAGRAGRLLDAIRVEGDWPVPRPGLVLLGLHWGTGILALELFRRAGLQPRFVYRGIDRDGRNLAPFLYLYQAMTIRAIDKACAGRAIATPGAATSLQQALGDQGTPVLLLDAPPELGRRVAEARLLGQPARLAAGGMEMLAARNAQCQLFDLGLEAHGPGRVLRMQPVQTARGVADIQGMVSGQFDRLVGTDSAQWRLWHVAEQLFGPAAASPGDRN